MWTPDNRLTLIRVKIERANKHLAELETALGRMGNAVIKSLVTDCDPETRKPRFNFRQYNIYTAEIPAIAGDVAHNLRSSLDHLVFHLVQVGIARGETRTFKMEDVQFPIFHSADSYEAGKVRRIQGARRQAIEAIDRLKPYKGGNDSLWLLRRLDNTDKHSFIIPVGEEGIVGGIPFNASEPFFTSFVDTKQHNNVDLAGQESAAQFPAVEGNALLPTFHQLAELVGNIVTEFQPLLG